MLWYGFMTEDDKMHINQYIINRLKEEDIKEYTPFNIEFEYLQEYDRNAKYKFAIVCSSSKDGDLFKGAGGSTLIVDEFEVICE
mgnify:CR=1 FL=1